MDNMEQVQLREIAPADIEAASFTIIADELGPCQLPPAGFAVLQRVIHATGDFSFADTIRFSPGAIDAALAAIRDGRDILTDVTMVAAGINKSLLAGWGGSVHCRLGDPAVAELARSTGRTRSEVAIEEGLAAGGVGILAIGNAPTALVRAIRLLAASDPANAPVVIGVPVGFVNAAESKMLLHHSPLQHITSLGRKGGSPVAAAMVNALLRLAAA